MLAATNRAATTSPGQRILGDDVAAPALLWHYPQLSGRIGFDARLEIYSQADLLAYVHFVAGDTPDWLVVARPYDLIVASDSQNPNLVALLRRVEGWRLLEHDARGTLLVRGTPGAPPTGSSPMSA